MRKEAHFWFFVWVPALLGSLSLPTRSSGFG